MSFSALLQIAQRIDTLARSLIGRNAFESINVLIPDNASPESGFIRATSWLYCLYFEGGRVSISFLLDAGEGTGGFNRSVVDEHIESVRSLRTELHHNLGFQDSDQRARTYAESWRRSACGTAVPIEEGQWLACYDKLVQDAESTLQGLEGVVRHLEADREGAEVLLDEWERRLVRTISAASFDPIIEDVKSRIGRNYLSTVPFRNRHLNRWRNELDLLDDGYDFEREATLLIEKALLDDGSGVLPITGDDIIEALAVSPGPVVGDLLLAARTYYLANMCTKEELLEHLGTLTPQA